MKGFFTAVAAFLGSAGPIVDLRTAPAAIKVNPRKVKRARKIQCRPASGWRKEIARRRHAEKMLRQRINRRAGKGGAR